MTHDYRLGIALRIGPDPVDGTCLLTLNILKGLVYVESRYDSPQEGP